jgi:hypothetical protein
LPERYYNRKHYHSVNCIVVCDHLCRVRYFTNRHAGSAHDSRIWEESAMKADLVSRFSTNQPQYLIGDEGFACSDTLLTVVREQQLRGVTDLEKKEKMMAYNTTFKKARISIEHCFGQIKKRFPALLYKLRCRKVENVQALIAAAIVLHNLLIKFREPEALLSLGITEEWYREQAQRLDMEIRQPENSRSAFRVRNHIIDTFF